MEILNEKYAVLYTETEFDQNETLAFFDTKEEMHELIAKLYQQKTKTNQPLAYFAYVFPKGSVYPDDAEGFWKRNRDSSRTKYTVGAGFYVQRTYKNGKTKGKRYNFGEDFDYQLDEWKAKGWKDIIILAVGESLSGDYYYEREIKKIWGDKDQPLYA